MMLIRSFSKRSSSVHGGRGDLDLNPKDVLVLFSLLSPFKKKCRKSLLFYRNEAWKKKDADTTFDVYT